jgi:hypothetical protein
MEDKAELQPGGKLPRIQYKPQILCFLLDVPRGLHISKSSIYNIKEMLSCLDKSQFSLNKAPSKKDLYICAQVPCGSLSTLFK